MRVLIYRHLSMALRVVAGVLFILLADIYFKYSKIPMQIRLARGVIFSNHFLRDAALKHEPSNSVNYLYRLQGPTPFHNIAAEIIEMERKRDMNEVINYLRRRTGEDLGDNPDAWIMKYGDEHRKHMQDIMVNK